MTPKESFSWLLKNALLTKEQQALAKIVSRLEKLK